MDYKELYILHLHFPASGALRDEVAMETPLHNHPRGDGGTGAAGGAGFHSPHPRLLVFGG